MLQGLLPPAGVSWAPVLIGQWESPQEESGQPHRAGAGAQDSGGFKEGLLLHGPSSKPSGHLLKMSRREASGRASLSPARLATGVGSLDLQVVLQSLYKLWSCLLLWLRALGSQCPVGGMACDLGVDTRS